MPNLTKGATVPGLYSHIAHSNDKEETDIPQPFKGAHPKQPKHRGGGKGKQPQQKPKTPKQIQDDQYNYEDTNNYYHNENYRGQLEDIDPTEAKIQVNSSEAKIHVEEVNKIRIHTKANIKTMAIKAIITKAIKVYIITYTENFNKVIIMANLEAEAMAEAEAIIMAVVMAGSIIKVILTTNTISIMVMMMSTRQINMVHHVHYAVATIILLNIALRESMISMTLWKR